MGFLLILVVGADFARDVQPILRERCHKCHGGIHRQGELSFLTRADALAILPSNERAIVPGDPQASQLLVRITASDPDVRMPPTGEPLTSDQIQLLRRWIEEGARWEQHWSFQAVRKPAKVVATSAWPRNPIDQFVLGQLNTNQIQPSPEADRVTLIRRLYLDLVGLLPSVEDVDSFCSDPREDAYERLVDRLLASPHFGERWGRHWLDQARYADTDGFEVDGARNSAWLWRNWVIDALNGDMPFDQFTLEQIAGDLLPSATPQQQLATGFHRQSLTNREGGIDKGEARYKELVDRINSVGTIWLGLTVGCAQCHDHPHDPITQREFFELYAFLDSTDDVELPVDSTQSNHRRESKEKTPNGAKSAALAAMVVAQAKQPRVTTMYRRGDFLQPGEPVQAAVFRELHPIANSSGASGARGKPLDRLDFARWIVAPENPLMPRVAANQLWIRLFGAGLVRTPDDFGAHGEPPTHSALLDWLANEYQQCRWSSKQMIRQIVTSATYRQSSRRRPEIQSLDPLNVLWHRQNRYRVEAELVHDLSLNAAGILTPEIGGPSFYPPLAEEVVKLSFRSNYVWKVSTGSDRYRRGMYIFYKRTLPHPNLDTFDCPDATTARMQRETSSTPLQALTSLNHEVFFEAAQALGQRVLDESPPVDRQRIDRVFQICLGRLPADAERQSLQRLLAVNRSWYQQHPDDASNLVGHHHSGDLELSEAASWAAICNVVLNLDEFLTRE